MSNPRRISRSELAQSAKITGMAIASGKVTGFLPEQNAAFSSELLAEANGLEADEKELVRMQTAVNSQLEKAKERRLRILDIITRSKYAMHSVGSPDSEYEAVGYDPPADPRSRVIPQNADKIIRDRVLERDQ